MSTTSVLVPEGPPATVAEQRQPRLRMGRSIDLPGTERTDGVWWPRSTDLVRELRPLLSELGGAGHMARRVTYNLDAWQPAPSKFAFNGRRLRLGGYRRLDRRVLHVTTADAVAPGGVVMTRIAPPLVVGVDGSGPSDEALRYACSQAVVRRLPLLIVHAWQPYPSYASGAMMGPGLLTPAPIEMADIGRQVLDAAAQIADGFGSALVHTEQLVEGAAAAALIEAADGALLLVVGGRDRTRHEPGWLGPVPLRLAAKSHCPVVVVPSEAHITGDVVVGVDGSEIAEDAVGFAFEQASRQGSALTAIHAFPLVTALTGLDTSLCADRRANAGRQLSETLSGWCEKYPDVVVTPVVTDETPLRALRAASATASLVVVSSHGRGFFLRHVVGSVSSALLRVSDCPVAVIRPATRDAAAGT
jgi:nucleotide-binding universal stress UspA family protein